MIGGFYKKGQGLEFENVADLGSGRLVIFISKYKVLFKRNSLVLLNILLCGKKSKFVMVLHWDAVMV